MTMPVELYQFDYGGDGDYLNYTSHDHDVSYGGDVFVVEPIRRTNIQVKDELSKLTLDVTMSNQNSTIQQWFADPDQRVFLRLFRQDETFGTLVIWRGKLINIKPHEASFVLTFESVFTSLRRPGLRPRFQLTCRHALYGPRCGASAPSHAVTEPATAISTDGLVLTVDTSGYDAGEFLGGMAQFNGAQRLITAHSTGSIRISRGIIGLAEEITNVGFANIILYPGCDRSTKRCVEKFNNLANNGSFRFIPIRNPFDGSSIV